MIFCEGELSNGTKYTKLAYLLLISGNSDVQKRMAFGEEKLVAPLIAIPKAEPSSLRKLFIPFFVSLYVGYVPASNDLGICCFVW